MPQRLSSASVMLHCLLSKTMTCLPLAYCKRSATARLSFLLPDHPQAASACID